MGSEPWFVGTPTMKSPMKIASDKLDIRLNATINKIDKVDRGWKLFGNNVNDNQTADIVIISAPGPQANVLTPFSNSLQSDLASITYDPCWALMTAFKNKTHNKTSTFKPETGVLSWVARNNSKPDRNDDMETWVAHASAEWSKKNLEIDKTEAADRLLPHLLNLLEDDNKRPTYLSAHRWRYARVNESINKPYLADETETVFVIGDGCLGPRIECAFESGMAAAANIINMLND